MPFVAPRLSEEDSGYETTDNDDMEAGELSILGMTAQNENEKWKGNKKRGIECFEDREEAVDDGEKSTLPKLFIRTKELRQRVEDIARGENGDRNHEVARAQVGEKRKVASDDEEVVAGPSQPKKTKGKPTPKPQARKVPPQKVPLPQAASTWRSTRRSGNRPGTRSTSTFTNPIPNPHIRFNGITYCPNPLNLPLPLSYLVQSQSQSTKPEREGPKKAWERLFSNEVPLSDYRGPDGERWQAEMCYQKDDIATDGIKGGWFKLAPREDYVPQVLGRVGTKTRMEREAREKERETECLALREGARGERGERDESVEVDVARVLLGIRGREAFRW